MEDENQLPTQEEVNEALVAEPDELQQFTDPEERKIAARLILMLTPKLMEQAKLQAEATKAKEMAEEVQAFRKAADEALRNEMDKLRKANTPLSPTELQQLVTQEYLEYPVTVLDRGSKQQRTFMIVELPALHEKRLLMTVNKTLGKRIKEISAIEWTGTDGMLQKIQRVVEMVPSALDTVADCVAVCLDPWSEDKEMNATWVMSNLRVNQMLAVLRLQAEANRWRDFFSLASPLIQDRMIA